MGTGEEIILVVGILSVGRKLEGIEEEFGNEDEETQVDRDDLEISFALVEGFKGESADKDDREIGNDERSLAEIPRWYGKYVIRAQHPITKYYREYI